MIFSRTWIQPPGNKLMDIYFSACTLDCMRKLKQQLRSCSLSERSGTGVPECREQDHGVNELCRMFGCQAAVWWSYCEGSFRVWNYSLSLEPSSSVTNMTNFNLSYWSCGCYVVILRENAAVFSIPLTPQ